MKLYLHLWNLAVESFSLILSYRLTAMFLWDSLTGRSEYYTKGKVISALGTERIRVRLFTLFTFEHLISIFCKGTLDLLTDVFGTVSASKISCFQPVAASRDVLSLNFDSSYFTWKHALFLFRFQSRLVGRIYINCLLLEHVDCSEAWRTACKLKRKLLMSA